MCNANGSVELYHDNDKKAETFSTGLKVTNGGELYIDGNAAGGHCEIIMTRSDKSWAITNQTNFRIYCEGGNSSNPAAGSLYLEIDGNGHVLPGSNDAQNLGSSGDSWKDLYCQGSQYMGEDGDDTTPWNNSTADDRGWNWQDNIHVFSIINNSDYSAMYINKISAGGITDYRWIDFRFDGSAVGKIWYTSNDVVLAQVSDYRLKENVVGITDGITRIKQLNPIKFNFKSDAPCKDPSILNEGFLAHELQAVIPQAAYGTKDGTKLNEEGQTVPDYQEVYTPKMIPTLTAALKEAIAKIETLETKVAALESA